MNYIREKSLQAFIVLVLILAISGCATNYYTMGTDFDEAKVEDIVKGETTEADLITLFGEPSSRSRSHDGQKTLVWQYFSQGMGSFSQRVFTPMKSLGGGGQTMKTLSVILSSDGTVESFTTSSSASGQQVR